MNRAVVYTRPKRLFSWGTRSGLVTRITRFHSLDETGSDMSLPSCVTEWITQFQSRDETSSDMSLSFRGSDWINQFQPDKQWYQSLPYCVTGFFSSVTLVLKQPLSRRVTATDSRPISFLITMLLTFVFRFPLTTAKHINFNNRHRLCRSRFLRCSHLSMS